MSVAISWANKMQLAKCDIMVGFCKSSHNFYQHHKHVYIGAEDGEWWEP